VTDTRQPTLSRPETDQEPFRLEIGAADFGERAFDQYAELRTACPVHRAIFTAGGDGQAAAFVDRPLWAVTGYDENAAAMLDDRLSVDPRVGLSAAELAATPAADAEFRPLFRNLLSLDPPDHTRLRRLVQPQFTARAVESWRPRIERIAAGLLDAAEAAAAARGETAPARSMELVAAYAFPLPITVIFELLGVPQTDRERVHRWTQLLLGFGIGGDDEAQRAGLRAFIGYGRELVAAKRARPADDLLTQLTQAEEGGDRLDEDELLSMIFILILAGHVTTVNLIANATYALLTHPAELAKLRADPELVKGAVEETLRCWGPVELASERFAREEIELGGVAIGQGEMVVPVLAAAGRDPARFPDPDRFDLERAESHRHLAFGKGIHACLGAPLARLEGQIALGALFGRYPDLRLAAAPDEIAWQALPLRGVTRLPLRF